MAGGSLDGSRAAQHASSARPARRPRRPGSGGGRKLGSFGIHNRLTGQLLGHVTRIGERLLGEADRPFDEVVVELDADLAQVRDGASLPTPGSSPTAMNPSWPSMLMSSTLARESSSVLRSRPIGLPRYQVNEKCGPRMPPPTSHWQPTEVRRRVDQTGDAGQFAHRLVADASALRKERSVRGVLLRRRRLRHLGRGRLRIGACGKHRNHGRSRHGQRLRFPASLPVAHVLGVTPCTVAAAQYLNHRHAD